MLAQFVSDLLGRMLLLSGGLLQAVPSWIAVLSLFLFFFPGLEGRMKNWLPSLRLHRTAIVFSLVLFAVIVAAFGQYTQAADKVAKLDAEVKRYQTSPAVDQIALMSYLKDIPIPLAGLAKDMTIIRNRTFDGCDIHGPAVVLLNYGTNQVFSCTVDAPFDAAFIVTTNTAATGIVAFDNCTFKNCKFRNVSFLGDSDAIAKVRSEFVFDSTK